MIQGDVHCTVIHHLHLMTDIYPLLRNINNHKMIYSGDCCRGARIGVVYGGRDVEVETERERMAPSFPVPIFGGVRDLAVCGRGPLERLCCQLYRPHY